MTGRVHPVDSVIVCVPAASGALTLRVSVPPRADTLGHACARRPRAMNGRTLWEC